MPIFNPPPSPPVGFFHAYGNATTPISILAGIAHFMSGNTPYDNTLAAEPIVNGSGGLLSIPFVIIIGQLSGIASSVGDTVTIIINGTTYYSQSISPSNDWSVNIDGIFADGTSEIELKVIPSDNTATDGTINDQIITIYPASLQFTQDSLVSGEGIGISILGNAPIISITQNYDWNYGIGTSALVPTSAWNNTDQYTMEVSTYGGIATVLMYAVTDGSTNLYPTSINIGYVLGA